MVSVAAKRLFSLVITAVFTLLIISASTAHAAEDLWLDEIVPRTVIALYDSENTSITDSNIHQMAEMPLNHIGLNVVYHDINEAFPSENELNETLGAICWFKKDRMKKPVQFINWASKFIESGKKFVLIGKPTFAKNSKDEETSIYDVNRLLESIGLHSDLKKETAVYEASSIQVDPAITGFERNLPAIISPYYRIWSVSPFAKNHFVMRRKKRGETESHLIVTTPNGGYAAENYAVIKSPESGIRQWFINPFAFFAKAFAVESMPKPDTTTLSGRRIFFSHIDANGWNIKSEISKEKEHKCSTVILERILKTNSDTPFSIAPVVSEISPKEYGNKEGLETLKKIFALKNIEAGTATYSHINNWDFYKNYTEEKEKPFKSIFGRIFDAISPPDALFPDESNSPRTFPNNDYSLDKEIKGSAKYLSKLLPKGKKVKLVQWTGDKNVFEKAIKKARKNGISNINGGKSRFDNRYPSYSYVSPIGVQKGKEHQIYSASPNEDYFTDFWKSDFYGFENLVHTLKNTEKPRRIKPLNLNFHLYSAQNEQGLKALEKNVSYIKTLKTIPLWTSRYSEIADSFYHARIAKTGNRKWRIENRKELNTIRFDEAENLVTDFRKSKGVISQFHYQGSLYLGLDKSNDNPVIALKDIKETDTFDKTYPYLKNSNWEIWNVTKEKNSISFTAQGIGPIEMVWNLPFSGTIYVSLTNSNKETRILKAVSSEKGEMKFKADYRSLKPVDIKIEADPHKTYRRET